MWEFLNKHGETLIVASVFGLLVVCALMAVLAEQYIKVLGVCGK